MKIKQRLLVFDSNALVIGTVKTPNNTNSQLDQRSETATRATGKIFNRYRNPDSSSCLR